MSFAALKRRRKRRARKAWRRPPRRSFPPAKSPCIRPACPCQSFEVNVRPASLKMVRTAMPDTCGISVEHMANAV